MATPEEEQGLGANAAPERPRTFVEDPEDRRPFMRGIMIHSLLARGISFADAFRTANEVRERVRGRPVVTRAELAKSVREILGEDQHERSGS